MTCGLTAIADKVRMLGRTDLDHEGVCVAARDRIVHLQRKVEALEAAAIAFRDCVLKEWHVPQSVIDQLDAAIGNR